MDICICVYSSSYVLFFLINNMTSGNLSRASLRKRWYGEVLYLQWAMEQGGVEFAVIGEWGRCWLELPASAETRRCWLLSLQRAVKGGGVDYWACSERWQNWLFRPISVGKNGWPRWRRQLPTNADKCRQTPTNADKRRQTPTNAASIKTAPFILILFLLIFILLFHLLHYARMYHLRIKKKGKWETESLLAKETATGRKKI